MFTSAPSSLCKQFVKSFWIESRFLCVWQFLAMLFNHLEQELLIILPFSQRTVVAHILARFFGPLNVEVVVEELQSVNTSVDRNIIIMIFRRWIIRLVQGRIYVGAGDTCPPDSLVAPQIQKLADRSDVIFEVPKCSKMQNFLGLRPGSHWVSLQRSPAP